MEHSWIRSWPVPHCTHQHALRSRLIPIVNLCFWPYILYVNAYSQPRPHPLPLFFERPQAGRPFIPARRIVRYQIVTPNI